MAQFKPRFASHFQLQNKSQPRRLSPLEPSQPCSWMDCTAKAVSEYKDKAYCASHLLRTLQKQWQE
jgi:hypothetical protein